MKTDTKLLSDYLSRSIAENQNLVRLIDTKANIIIVLIGVILSLFFNTFISKGLINIMQIYLILIPFLVSGFFAFLSIYPRTGKQNKDSLLSFYGAGKTSTEQWVKRFEGDYGKAIMQDYVDNIKAVSNIIKRKISYIRLSYIFLALAIIIKVIFELIIWIK